ncbi:MAG: PorT family protein [Marinilabiliaceae bacterium]|nr:PorT family protein [Marinilabiliaceae bacterium]
MKKLILIVALLGVMNSVHAQWRIGATAGFDWNHYKIDNHYMTDWHYEGKKGLTLGVASQYGFNDWLALRAEVNYTQKNHRQFRTGQLSDTDYDTKNSYLQMPIMSSFSFGGEKLRGFMNLGIYGGYWLSSAIKGSFFSPLTFEKTNVDEKVEFVSDRDQRFDFGAVGGVGLEYKIGEHWAAQIETRCYYSTISTQKDYMAIKDPKYNTTIGVQAAFFYIF